ncbi:MAG: tRNA lysidine(34) synthetase TilS [Magnetococcales bacterium]|nr:tRNA lysidine(34) synthetase TilS [Magnetococcales bacterium]
MNHPTRDPLLQRFHTRLRPLLSDQARVVVAVSGGADSLALLHLLRADPRIEGTRLLVAHFDHALRADSHLDAQFVGEQADHLGLACRIGKWESPTPGGNLQERAREARLAFLLSCAQSFEAEAILTGHHQDDQAETFLERLLRGGGVTGLSAMRAERFLGNGVRIVRPLLGMRRETLRAWLMQRGVTWREDPSNAQEAYRRNWLRHRLMPLLNEALPDHAVTACLAETAERLAQADKALEWSLEDYWPRLDARWSREAGIISVDFRAFTRLPEALAHRVLTRCHAVLTGNDHPPGARAMTQLSRMIHGKGGAWHMHVDGLRIKKAESRIYWQRFMEAPRKRSRTTEEKEMWEMVEFYVWDPYHECGRFTHPDAQLPI